MTFSEPNPEVRPVGAEPAEFIDPVEPAPPRPPDDRPPDDDADHDRKDDGRRNERRAAASWSASALAGPARCARGRALDTPSVRFNSRRGGYRHPSTRPRER